MALTVPPFLSHLYDYSVGQIAGYVLNQNPDTLFMGTGQDPENDPSRVEFYTPGSVSSVIVKPFSKTALTLTFDSTNQRTMSLGLGLRRDGDLLGCLPAQRKDYPFVIFDLSTEEWCIVTPQFARFMNALHTGQCLGKKSLLHGILGSKMTVFDKDFPNTFAISNTTMVAALQGYEFRRYSFVYLALKLWYPDYLTLFTPSDYLLIDNHVREWFGDIYYYPAPETRFVEEATALLDEIL